MAREHYIYNLLDIATEERYYTGKPVDRETIIREIPEEEIKQEEITRREVPIYIAPKVDPDEPEVIEVDETITTFVPPEDQFDWYEAVIIEPDVGGNSLYMSYRINSDVPIPPVTYKFTNRLSNMSVIVQLSGPTGVRLFKGGTNEPKTRFVLEPKTSDTVDVQMVTKELEGLNFEGLLDSAVKIILSTGTITLATDRDDNISL